MISGRTAALQPIRMPFSTMLPSSMMRRKCHLLPHSTLGSCNVIHVLEFEDDTKWIVRFQLSPSSSASAKQLQSEVDTMTLLSDYIEVSVPKVYGFDAEGKSGVGVPFIIMKYTLSCCY